MLFLTDVDHVSFEKANETRQNNLQSATVSLQVVIGLCKRKETAALKIKAAVSLRLHKPMTGTIYKSSCEGLGTDTYFYIKGIETA